MTTFDDRERSFEKKFAMDEELRFKATARRDALLGEWAAAKLGLSGAAVADYGKALRKAQVSGRGESDVFEKVLHDLTEKGVGVTAGELREVMRTLMNRALGQLKGGASGV
jgi:hypothetical protein